MDFPIKGDFVIDSTYIQELASQVLNADEKVSHTPSFQEVCDTLRSLCDEVASSLKALKDIVPGTLGSETLQSETPGVVPLNPLPPED
jgi:hypothetical protein